jgi:hypothetical protein
MKHRNNLSDHNDCSYFQVKKSFSILIAVGIYETNTYIGSSCAFGTLYRKVELQPGNEVHDLPGGVFVFLDGVAYRAKTKLSEKGFFEKVYGVEEEVYPIDCLEQIDKGKATAGQYNSRLPLAPAPSRYYGRSLDAIEGRAA